jgi:RNA polymerase sigma-70 factor (ECF subfamily)
MGAAPDSEREFASLLASGEQRRAAEWLVHRYADEVMGLCLAMVRHRSTAEDLVQDVFGRAFVGLKDFRGEASARTWLLKIARNRCFDHLRARQREPWGNTGSNAPLEPDALPDEVPLPHELLARRADVEAALAGLPEADRAMIVLRFRNGLDYGELAIAFGLRQGTVRMRVSRSLQRMRRALEQRDAVERAELAPPRVAPEPWPELTTGADSLDAEGAGALDSDEDAFADFAAAPAEPEAELADWDESVEQDLAPPPPRAGAAVERTRERRAPLPARASAPPPPPPPPAPQSLARARKAAPAGASPIFARPAAPPAPPIEHPLTAFFAATREALSGELRAVLLAQAGQA